MMMMRRQRGVLYLLRSNLGNILVRPRACPGLATHTLAGLCAQWLPSTAYITEQLQNVIKPEEASQTTCTAAVPQPPVQAPPDLLTTPQGPFDLAVAQDMPRAGHSHNTGGALCALVAEHRLHH